MRQKFEESQVELAKMGRRVEEVYLNLASRIIKVVEFA